MGAGQGLRDARGRVASGLHGRGDAFAVVGRDHAAGVAHEDEALNVVRLAVEAHGQSGGAKLTDLVLGGEAPFLGQVRGPALEDLTVGQVGGAGARGDGAEADVDDAVAHGEDPAVAGQQVGGAGGAAPQFEVGFHPFLVAAGAVEVGACGHAHGAVHLLFEAEAGSQSGGHSPGVDDDRGAHRGGGRVLATPALSRHADDASGAILDGADDGDALVEAGAGFDGALRERVVEVHAGAGHAVAGQGLLIGPIHVDSVAAANDGQAAVSHPAGGVHAHRDELVDGGRGEPIAADFVARERAFLQEDDIEACSGQVIGGGGPARACADDDNVSAHVARHGGCHGIPPSCGARVHPRECARWMKCAHHFIPQTTLARSPSPRRPSALFPTVSTNEAWARLAHSTHLRNRPLS